MMRLDNCFINTGLLSRYSDNITYLHIKDLIYNSLKVSDYIIITPEITKE